MKKLLCLLVAAWLHVSAWAAAAVAVPVVTITANGQALGDGSVRLVDREGDVSFWEVAGGTLAFGDGSVTVNPFTFSYDADPFVSLSVATVNSTNADVTMLFTVSAPYVGGPWNHLSTQLSGTVVDERQGQAALTAVSLIGRVDGTDRLTTLLPDCFNPGVGGCGAASGSTAIPTTAATGAFGLQLAFTTSSRDKATLLARVDLTSTPPVPEPETYALMLAGLAALGVVTRRRRAR